MDFKLSDVRDSACVYLIDARESFENFQCEIHTPFEWSEDMWDYVDHFYIELEGKNLWSVYEFVRGEGIQKADKIPAEQVVSVIHTLSKGVFIDEIR